MKGLRAFEMFVVALVLGVVICFCIQLSLIENTSVGEVLRGYLPSKAIIQSQGYTNPFPPTIPITLLTFSPVFTKHAVFSVQQLCLTVSTLGVA